MFQQAPSSVPMSPPLYHSTIQALENFHDSIEDVWIYIYIYKVAHTYINTFLQTISHPPDVVSLDIYIIDFSFFNCSFVKIKLKL